MWMFTALSAVLLNAFQANPVSQAIINTTLVILKTTEVVWRPVLNASLTLMKPLGPLALVVGKQTLKVMIALGYLTFVVIAEAIEFARYCFRTIQAAGMNVSMALGNAFEVSKDFVYSLGTLMKAFTYFTIRLVNTASYIVTSFEKVSDFLYNLVFNAHKLTWDDVYAISLPFLVVTAIVGYVLWRTTASCRKQVTHEKKCEEIVVPRRSSRLARKRAMLYAADLSPVLARCETTTSPANL